MTFAGRALHPPVPIERLVEEAGFRVVVLFELPDRLSGLVSPPDNLIGVNGRHHRHRRRFSVAHEFGHILLSHPPEARCSTPDIRLFDLEADRCASELLMPGRLLVPLVEREPRAGALAVIFDVSAEAMEIRLRSLRMR